MKRPHLNLMRDIRHGLDNHQRQAICQNGMAEICIRSIAGQTFLKYFSASSIWLPRYYMFLSFSLQYQNDIYNTEIY